MNKDKFKIGDRVKSKVKVKIIDGSKHLIGDEFIINSTTVEYFNNFFNDYELVEEELQGTEEELCAEGSYHYIH